MDAERRGTPDQRRVPTRPLSPYSFWGRRKKARRKVEDSNYYVDRYEPRYFALISVILALCVLDAYLTFRILDLGGEELNRLMLVFVYKHPVAALVFKYFITALSIVFILIHKNFLIFGRLRVSLLIYIFFAVYLILVSYEAIIFFNHIRTLGL
jgi:hypothetical protein